MKIKIKGKNYQVKYTIRALFIFESITGKPFEIKTLLDNYLLFYSMILANNMDNPIQWDEFIDALDNDPALKGQLEKILIEYNKSQDIFNQEDEKTGQKKS